MSESCGINVGSRQKLRNQKRKNDTIISNAIIRLE